MDLKISENEKNCNITYINNEFTPRMQQTKLDTTGLMSTSNICAIVTPPSLDKNCFNHENDDGANGNNQNNDLFDNNERKNSGRTNNLIVGGHVGNKNNNNNSGNGKDGNTKLCKLDRKRNCNRKNKRKRRRGKQKTNSTKPFKKDNNWKFQMPQRYRSNSNTTNLANMTNVLRKQIQRQRSIVPYNTNKFLMEEHLAEVPSALLTPNGRTRDSSFSVDSEDNYFFSLPEDEEEFLTKEFSNVYERARVERLENMNKQQLIEECLQMEDRCSQLDSKQHEEFVNKIKFLEEKIQRLNKENNELRRRLDHSTNNSGHTTKISHKCKKSSDNMSCSSEDSESDSSSTSSSSSSSCSSCSTSSISEYSLPCSPQSQGGKNHSKNITNGSEENMEADNQISDEQNDQPIINNLNNEEEHNEEEQEMQQQHQIESIQLLNQDEDEDNQDEDEDNQYIIQNNSVEQEHCLTLNTNEINEQEPQENNHNGIILSQRECTNDNN